ncbi:MAG: helix-turn-helix transcriptional regulator [Candidatus Pelagadaptatus aseana]|uniref:helix-turn-helix domain-containing protein n=1 Tax=Candidatus Pelagadaptatus aseana TaxID=3120508 RepID=UPI0039B265AE
MTTPPSREASAFSSLLRFWRGAYNLSQEALALQLDSSSRHISFLENGRAHPSVEMVEKIADELGLHSRDRNHLLVAAGYMPRRESLDFSSEKLRWLRNAMVMTLKSLDPYPATLNDDQGKILMVNRGWVSLFRQILSQEQLDRVDNHFEFLLDCMGDIGNNEQWRDTVSVVMMSLTQHTLLSGGDPKAEILKRLEKHPNLPSDWKQRAAQVEPMASYRIQIEMQGKAFTFYNISQMVGAAGPAAYVSSPHLFTSTLYPEDTQLDLGQWMPDTIKHPLLFY